MTEILDLTQYSWDELSGKALRLNGAEYVLGEMVGEGTQKATYAMRNVRTGLQQLAAKVFKDTLESEAIRQSVLVRQSLFAMLVKDPNALGNTPEELYPFPGCVVGIELLHSRWNEAAQDVSRAHDLLRAREYSAALEEYKQVLRRKPDHSFALSEMGACLLNMRCPRPAIECIRAAIELEPNLYADYCNLAVAFRYLDQIEDALEAIEQGLRRYRLSPHLWSEKLELATDLGRISIVSDMLHEVEDQLDHRESAPLVRHLRDRLEVSGRNKELRERAESLYRSAEWGACSQAWDEYFSRAHGLVNDHLFDYQSKYKAGNFAAAARVSISALQSEADIWIDSFALLAVASTVKAGETQLAAEIGSQLLSNCPLPADLPGWPERIIWYEFEGRREPSVLESLDHSEILAVLKQLRDDLDADSSTRARIERLVTNYEVRMTARSSASGGA